MKLYRVFCLVFLTLTGTAASVKTRNDFYTAAVVEFNPSSGNIFDALSENLEAYGNLIGDAKKQHADIIVFPECTLNKYEGTELRIPHEDEEANPCLNSTDFSRILVRISCAARVEQIYVVVNLAEKFDCSTYRHSSKCPPSGYFLFNTNVVFDRSGQVISRYRKINLFGEPGFTESLDSEPGIFETDFGVRFGHFICFDLMFQFPAVHLLAKKNISNVVFPTMWFSEMPFLTAVEIQESWAYTHNVNLLAAGANDPKVGSTGSGIYSGRWGALTSSMNGEAVSRLLVASVPKTPPKGDHPAARQQLLSTNSNRLVTKAKNPATVMDNLFLKQDNLSVYTTELLKIQEEQEVNLTMGELECHFHVEMNLGLIKLKEGRDQYLYRAVAFEGVRSYTYKTGGVENCAIVACTNASLNSCATRFPNHTTFQPTYEITKISITAMVPKPIFNESMYSPNIVYHPVTLDTSIMPLGVAAFSMNTTALEPNSTKQMLSMTLAGGHYRDLLAFGFMGRSFDRDGQDVTGAANIASGSWTILLATLFSVLNYFVKRI